MFLRQASKRGTHTALLDTPSGQGQIASHASRREAGWNGNRPSLPRAIASPGDLGVSPFAAGRAWVVLERETAARGREAPGRRAMEDVLQTAPAQAVHHPGIVAQAPGRRSGRAKFQYWTHAKRSGMATAELWCGLPPPVKAHPQTVFPQRFPNNW